MQFVVSQRNMKLCGENRINMKYINYEEDNNKESAIAVINDDGVLELVYTEERYNRKKYSDIFPYHSIEKLVGKFDKDIKMYAKNDKERYLFKSLIPAISFEIKNEKKYSHHLLHCYETFYTSGFDRAAVLVADGYGDDPELGQASIVLYHKIGTETKILRKYSSKDSLGKIYSKACSFLGFKNNQEGEFMGLSAYGKPYKEHYFTFTNGEIVKNNTIEDWDRKYYVSGNHVVDIINATNFAATVQRDLNESIIEILKYLKELTHEDNLCLSGGIFNNVITNNLVCESGIFKNIWCSPAPGDYGLTVGLASFSYECDNENAKSVKLQSPYLGEEFTDDIIIKFLESNEIPYEIILLEEISKFLVNNKIIAWFQGRSEYGRRALGHRSILCNPYYRINYNKVSMDIKKREAYRPLACTVPSELFDSMFDVKNKDLTEFMLRSIPVKDEIKLKIPACLAIDGTTRPQRLERKVDPEFYDMIMSFYNITGIPCVVNTSLNGGGEPIIENLKDCFIFLKEHQLVDYLVLNGKYVIKNNKNIKIVDSQLNKNDDNWGRLIGR